MRDSITTTEAAAELGVSRSRVLALIRAGRLPAERFGDQYVIRYEDLALVRERKTGRPPKARPDPGGPPTLPRSQPPRRRRGREVQ